MYTCWKKKAHFILFACTFDGFGVLKSSGFNIEYRVICTIIFKGDLLYNVFMILNMTT